MCATPNEPSPELRAVPAADPDWLPQLDGDDPEAAPWSDGQPMHVESLDDLDGF